MIKKLVIVPKNESYYFCKRIFFSMFGDIGTCFADCIALSGWVCYPYYEDSEDPDILLFANENNLSRLIGTLDDSENGKIYTKYRLGTIITDSQNINDTDKAFFDQIIDISSLYDYYKTELNLSKFIKSLTNLEIKDIASLND